MSKEDIENKEEKDLNEETVQEEQTEESSSEEIQEETQEEELDEVSKVTAELAEMKFCRNSGVGAEIVAGCPLPPSSRNIVAAGSPKYLESTSLER